LNSSLYRFDLFPIFISSTGLL